ncbi:uncharacterized protein LOC131666458 [Phymastichus coffea]|uniref:uncharacterized protein LOC131666458 n=1 Tax=Phymastichus coffea TaxID=108790 RepID=UPI00273CCD98|nr:uncharacterized protein LOC131666458 [Phymastichus coffea]
MAHLDTQAMQSLMQSQREIQLRDLQQVLRRRFGDGVDLLDFSSEALVKPGDNYGSTMLKVTASATFNDRDGVEKLHLVAKMLPTSHFQRIVYQCNFTVKKEIFAFEEMLPVYRSLYVEEFDVVPKFFGARLSAEPDTYEVDDDAVILLENLKEAKYVMENRFKGLTMDHMRIALPAIARFHAIGMAIKQKNPTFFAKIKRYARPLDMPDAMISPLIIGMQLVIKKEPQLAGYYERVMALYKCGKTVNCFLQTTLEPDDPWACIVHRDLWNNNVMFHIDEQSQKIDAFKFFDFQNYCFSSPMTDLLFFLFSSMQRDLANVSEAIELYRVSAYETLEKLTCDASLFDQETFEVRLKEDARSELYHSILMARTVELRSVEEFVQPTINEFCLRRILRILEIYDDKKWF